MISDINLTVILITCILFLIVERCNTKTQQEHFKYIKLKNDGDLNIWKEDDLKNAVRETIKGPILGKSLNNGKTKIDKINGNLNVPKFTMDKNSIVNVTRKHTDPSQNLISPKISVGKFEKAVEAESGIFFRSYEADEEYGSGIILADNVNGEFRHNAVGIHHHTTSLIKYDTNGVVDNIKIHSKIQITGSPLPNNATGTLQLTEGMIERYNALADNPNLNPAFSTDQIWQGLLKKRYTKMVVTFNVCGNCQNPKLIISPRTDYWQWDKEKSNIQHGKIATKLWDSLKGIYVEADTIVSNDMSQGGIGKYFPFLSGDSFSNKKPTKKPNTSIYALNGMDVELSSTAKSEDGNICGPQYLWFTSNWGGQSMTVVKDYDECRGDNTFATLTFTPHANGPWKGDWTKR